MSNQNENHRETGARKLKSVPDETDRDRQAIDAAENRSPPSGQGLSSPVDETNEKTRQSDGVRQKQPKP